MQNMCEMLKVDVLTLVFGFWLLFRRHRLL